MTDIERLDQLRKKKKENNNKDIERLNELRGIVTADSIISDLDSLNSMKSSFDYSNSTYNTAQQNYSNALKQTQDYTSKSYSAQKKIKTYLEKNSLDDNSQKYLSGVLKDLENDRTGISDYEKYRRSELDYFSQFKTQEAYDAYELNRKIGDMSLDDLKSNIDKTEADRKAYTNEHGGELLNKFQKYLSGLVYSDGKDLERSVTSARSNLNEISKYDSLITQYKKAHDDKVIGDTLNKLDGTQRDYLDKYVDSLKDINTYHEQMLSWYAIPGNANNPDNTLFLELQKQQAAAIDEKKKLESILESTGDEDWDKLAEYRKRQKDEEDMQITVADAQKSASEHPVVSSAASVVMAPAKILALRETLKNALAPTEGLRLANINSPDYTPAKVNRAIREQVMQETDWNIGSIDAFDFLYGTGMSMADSLYSGLLSGGSVAAASAIVGSQVMADTILDVTERGGSAGRALVSGAVAGIFEGLFESVSFSNLKSFGEQSIKNLFTADGIKTTLKNIAKSTFTNATEETFTEVANIIYDTLVNGDISNYTNMYEYYINEGLTEEEAKRKVAVDLGKQVVSAGAGGALMGMAFGGGGSLFAGTVNGPSSYGKTIKYDGDTEALYNQVKEYLGENSRAYSDVSSAMNAPERKGVSGIFADMKDNYRVGRAYFETTDKAGQVAQAADNSEYFQGVRTSGELEATKQFGEEIYNADNERLYQEYKKISALFPQSGQASSEAAEGISVSPATDNASQGRTANEGGVSDTDPITQRANEIKKPVVTANEETGKVEYIKEVKDGSVSLMLSDGSTVTADNVTFQSDDTEKIYNAAEKYDTETARVFVEAFAYNRNNIKPDDFVNAFDAYRNAAAEGTPARVFESDYPEYTGTLIPLAVEKVYKLTSKSRATVPSRPSGKTKLTIDKSINAKSLTASQKAAVSALRKISAVVKANIVVYSSETGSNGYFDPSKNEIGVNLLGDYSIVQTAAHELTHYTRRNNPEGYESLKNYLFEKYEKVDIADGDAIEVLVQKHRKDAKASKDNSRELSYDDAVEEIVADACQNMLKDSAAIEELARQNMSLAKTIKKWIDDFVKAIKSAFSGTTRDSMDYTMLKRALDDVTELQRLWDDALVGAVKSENARVSNEVKYSSTSKDYSYETFVRKPDMQVTFIDDTATPEPSSEARKKVVADAKKNAALIGTVRSDGSVSVNVSDIKTDVILSTDGLKHGLDRRFQITAPIVLNSGHILSNAIKINDLVPMKETASESYVLLGAAKNSKNDLYVVSFIINKHTSELSSVDVLYSINTKTESAGSLSPRLTEISAADTDSKISISDFLVIVNKYFPDVLPEDVLRHFGHSYRPDGIIGSSALYSDRDASSRAFLAEALKSHEGISDKDKVVLNKYRVQIDALDALQDELSEVNKQIHNTAFTRGTDRSILPELQKQASELAKKIDVADKKLLGLEFMDVIKAVHQRALKAQYRKGKQELKEYKAERKATAGKRKSLASIESNVSDLMEWVTNPKQGKSVPVQMRDKVVRFLSGFNLESGKGERRGNTQKDMRWQESASKLLDYLSSPKEDEATLFVTLDPSFVTAFKEFLDSAPIDNATSLYDLEAADLEKIEKLVKMVKGIIRNTNKTYAGERTAYISDLANEQIKSLQSRDAIAIRGLFELTGKIGNVFSEGAEMFSFDQMDSFTYAKLLGSTAESHIFKNLRDGFDIYVDHIREGQAKFAQITEGTVWDKWRKESQEFELEGGKISLTVSQLMSLYLTADREQGLQHILGGGIVFRRKDIDALRDLAGELGGNKKLTAGEKAEEQDRRINEVTPTTVTEKDLQAMFASLTDEQIEVAVKLRDFLAKEAAMWGNEVTQRLYLYDGYTEDKYWTIQSSKDFVNANDKDLDTASLWALKNQSFTKSLVKRANNPIVITDTFDLWADHVTGMASYNAFTLPLADAMRWYNYKESTPISEGSLTLRSVSVQNSLHNVYSKKSNQYFINFIKDLNGTQPVERGVGILSLLTRFTKSAAVGLNLSVAIQQPISYLRAMNVISPKYLLRALGERPNIELSKKYCPIAWWKSEGYFTTDVGRGMREVILDNPQKMQKAREWAMWLAGKADEVTWGALWNAAAHEVKDTTNLKRGTEEFNKAVGKRLTEIIDQTQVVDSVFHRSQGMRSKSLILNNLVYSFFTEQNKSANVFMRAAIDSKRTGNAKAMAMASFTYILSQFVLSVVKSLVTALRDDDEDEEYGEKYIQALKKNLLDNNPLEMVPFAKNIISIFSGYEDAPLTSATFKSTYNAAKAIGKYFNKRDELTPTEKRNTAYNSIYFTAQALSQATGIPAGNAVRELKSIYNLIADKNIGADYKISAKYDVLREAIASGDTELYNKTYARLIEDGKSPDDIESGLKKALKDNDPRIQEAAVAQYEAQATGNWDKADDIQSKIIGDGFDYDIVIGAFNSAYNAYVKEQEGDERTTILAGKYSELINSVTYGWSNNAINEARKLKKEGVEELMSKGMSKREAETKAEGNIRSSLTSNFKEEYYELRYQAYTLGDESAKRKLDTLKTTLRNLKIGYTSETFVNWNEGYSEWKKENK